MDNVFLILGGSSDIGRMLISRLNTVYSNSAFITSYYSNKDLLNELEMTNQNIFDPVYVDFSDERSTDQFIEYIKNKYQNPTHIIHLAAGKMEYEKFKNLKWNKLLDEQFIQVHSIISILQAFISDMGKRTQNDKVVFMLSSVTNCPAKFLSGYTMNKHMLLGLMRSLAVEYAGRKINFNGLSPDMIETKFLSLIDSRMIEMNAAHSVNKRNADINEVTDILIFLLSQQSNYMNGVNLNATGGNIII